MPEQVKGYVTLHDIKLVISIVALMAGGFISWGQLEKDVQELQIKLEFDRDVRAKQLTAIKDLTTAVQNLNVTTGQLEVRMKNLESLFPELRRQTN